MKRKKQKISTSIASVTAMMNRSCAPIRGDPVDSDRTGLSKDLISNPQNQEATELNPRNRPMKTTISANTGASWKLRITTLSTATPNAKDAAIVITNAASQGNPAPSSDQAT